MRGWSEVAQSESGKNAFVTYLYTHLYTCHANSGVRRVGKVAIVEGSGRKVNELLIIT